VFTPAPPRSAAPDAPAAPASRPQGDALGGELPLTGADSARLATAGALTVGAGAALIGISRQIPEPEIPPAPEG
jgi:hypothetical protein